ncbi:NTP pyrophosphatase (non-canonical NTP hydrolase) [Rhizobium skierniewicense]|uniref:NTP pyrophosphatase (Non-canonical NTP hydrolase) n=1 Tax=Rhizobium skierniewicense TaxID=984260 RepID=A0A7W6G0T3_9HYPH|nr:MazG nucleotide pyrophosphohydrolase domain-containing protein [Rhizobium skierniewicense]MBB3945005.1 NTP pyrophosphatase (non-canonical NTP hydrolase) [Rhizobium skierniewicense]NTF31069.1 pyrophosphatase [Rhizobium skierniewicense]
MLTKLMQQFESASQTYAKANGIERDPDWYLLKLQEEVGEVTQAWNRLSGRGRSKGKTQEEMRRDLSDETADVLGHVLLLAHHSGLDLDESIKRKWLFDPSV